MPKKNSPTKPVHSFRLSLECVRQLKDLSGIMGRSEGDVVEVSIDRMYRGELRFGNLMIGDAGSDIGASTARSGKTVSIHAPHAGSDFSVIGVRSSPGLFQSTLKFSRGFHRFIVSIHAPRTGSDDPDRIHPIDGVVSNANE